MNIAFVNGEFCPLADAKISVFDRGFLFGDAIYEVLPVYHGQPYFVEHHIERLTANLKKIKISLPDYDWELLIKELIARNNGDNLQIYIHVTRGDEGLRRHDIPPALTPSIIAFTIHNKFPTQEEKEKGLAAKLIEDIRWSRCDIKTTSLLANILLNDEAVANGFQTSILIRDGIVTEGSTSNVFLVTQNGLIKTPALNNFCLPGVTRLVAIELMQKLDWNISVEADIKAQELFKAKEVWISSTTKEIYPVTKINDSLINQGQAGTYWQQLNHAYQQLIS